MNLLSAFFVKSSKWNFANEIKVLTYFLFDSFTHRLSEMYI